MKRTSQSPGIRRGVQVLGLTLALVPACSALVSGCETEDDGAKTNDQALDPTILPECVFQGEGSGGEEQPPLNGWVWANATDAVVWARLVELRPTLRPLVLTASTGDQMMGDLVDDCDGLVHPGLTLEIEVVRSLLGDLTPTQRVLVSVGKNQLNDWHPNLKWQSQDGQWQQIWQGAAANEPLPLQANTGVGLALHWMAAEQLWSLMGEPPFTLEGGAEAVVRFQRQSLGGEHDESFQYPEELEGLTLDELEADLRAEHPELTQEVASRRTNQDHAWGASSAAGPKNYVAGTCVPSAAITPEPEGSGSGEGAEAPAQP